MPDDLRIIRGLLARNYPGTSVDRERQAAAFRAGMEKAAHVVSGIVDGSTYEDAEAKIVFAIAAHDVAVAVARNAGRNPNGTPAGPFADDHGPGAVAKKETP